MAILTSSGINGFIGSVKKVAGKYIEEFLSGFAGYGWRIWKRINGKYCLEIDDIVVRNTMTVFELIISKIRAVKGALGITQASGKVKSVTEDDYNYYLTIEDEMSFMSNDIVRCQAFNGESRSYWVVISAVDGDKITIPKTQFDEEMSVPQEGDELVQFGNLTNKARQSAIYLHADENGVPAIDVMFGINKKSFDNCVKTRIGGALPGEPDDYKGFFCENGLIKSVNDKGEEMYKLRPDGSGFIAKGNISWDADGNGSIFDRAIYWDKEGFHFSPNIKLTWDNLSEDARENLKGNAGTSIIFKGSYSSHPTNPENGWSYYNIAEKKSYVYQDNTWYQMTVDGVAGANGADGNNGLSIIWKGELSVPPQDPQINWVYRDTDDGFVYIFTGTDWKLMVADGSDGADGAKGEDGLSVFITYHDSVTKPGIPEGDGTTNGWHTAPTEDCIWMSQKVAKSSDSEEWGKPIKIKGEAGKNAELPDWLEEWNGVSEIGGEKVLVPKIFAGTKDAETGLTGVAVGKGIVDGESGIYAYKDNDVTFAINSNTGQAVFKGTVSICDEKILLNEDGSGHLAGGSISWQTDGSAEFKGNVKAESGKIGNLTITANGALRGGNAIFDAVDGGWFISSDTGSLYENYIIDRIDKSTTILLSYVMSAGINTINGERVVLLPNGKELHEKGISKSDGFLLRLIATNNLPFGGTHNITFNITSRERVKGPTIVGGGEPKLVPDGEIHDNNDNRKDFIPMAKGDVLELYHYNGVYYITSWRQ